MLSLLDHDHTSKQILPAKTSFLSKVVIVVLILIIVVLIIVLVIMATNVKCSGSMTEENRTFLSCKNDAITIDPKFVDENDIFRGLSGQEIENIKAYITEHFPINAPNDRNTCKALNFIKNINLYIPEKKQALKYLDENGEKPPIEASVTQVENIYYYIVGPLPNPTYHKLQSLNDRENPSKHVPMLLQLGYLESMKNLSKLLFTQMRPLFKATYETFNDIESPEELFKKGLRNKNLGGLVKKDGELRGTMAW